jgi:hypothetical protein
VSSPSIQRIGRRHVNGFAWVGAGAACGIVGIVVDFAFT